MRAGKVNSASANLTFPANETRTDGLDLKEALLVRLLEIALQR